MLTVKIAQEALKRDSRVHHFWEVSSVLRSIFSDRVIKVVTQETLYSRVWNEEKWQYEYVWPMVNTELENNLLSARAARKPGDFDCLLQAEKGGTILPFDYFVNKLVK